MVLLEEKLLEEIADLKKKVNAYREWLFCTLANNNCCNQIESQGWVVLTASQQKFVKLFGESPVTAEKVNDGK